MQTTIEITNKEGLHARPSSMISELANKYSYCNIKLITEDGREADAKSTVEIMILGILYKEKITIVANGKDEIEIIDRLKKLIQSNFKKEIQK
ncbi:HPr family phosphocarrier protein [Borrelia hispanica]|uniref:HPr family phosphocarrier protein n=1 Tax=Borrelia hispanica TaxID=40835 RepID=UPI0004645BB0|nr:HPr family phosphocarrier protein [Borrelia hispanica]